MPASDDIRHMWTALFKALATDNDQMATLAAMQLLQLVSIDLHRVADALERIAKHTDELASQ